jgi:hypothetical protein
VGSVVASDEAAPVIGSAVDAGASSLVVDAVPDGGGGGFFAAPADGALIASSDATMLAIRWRSKSQSLPC